jgi:hypothetical protein
MFSILCPELYVLPLNNKNSSHYLKPLLLTTLTYSFSCYAYDKDERAKQGNLVITWRSILRPPFSTHIHTQKNSQISNHFLLHLRFHYYFSVRSPPPLTPPPLSLHAPKDSSHISLNTKTFLNHDPILASTNHIFCAKNKSISYITCQYLWQIQRVHFVSVFPNEVLVE